MTEWYILPGMGASPEMYDSLRRELSIKVHFLEWPRYRNEVSYREIGKRIIAENEIREKDVIGGSSLGGMIALEAAAILNAKAVVLIGSALYRTEINHLLLLLSAFATMTPFSLIQQLAGKSGHLIGQMFSVSDPDFIRSMCKYISSWSGYHGVPAKVFRVHGEKDHIITCPEGGCDVINNAGHFVAITHAKECSEFLEKAYSHL